MIPKEFLGAFKAGHRKTSREFIDERLSLTLLKKVIEDNCEESRKTLEYITRFNNEFHKNVIKKGDPKALHSTDELRKDCYARENARNRDICMRSGFEQDLKDAFYQSEEQDMLDYVEDSQFIEDEICN